MIEIHPRAIRGAWDDGYVLDLHTISSTLIGQNQFGHLDFDTVRSELGELVYRLKYKTDRSALMPIVEVAADFVKKWNIRLDAVPPVPPSKTDRLLQPVNEIATQLANSLGVVLNTTALKKSKTTQQMKDIGDFSARTAALESSITSTNELTGKHVLLSDDLFQSGATMNVAARVLKQQGLVEHVYALALTRTRN